MSHIVNMGQLDERQHGAYGVGYGGRDRCAFNAHTEVFYKHYIEYHIDYR